MEDGGQHGGGDAHDRLLGATPGFDATELGLEVAVFPKPGGKVWYDDQREVHRQIFEGDETIDYAFMGQKPDAADNRWLRQAFDNAVPIIYFPRIAPGRYQAMLPAFISGWDAKALKAHVAFGISDHGAMGPPENAVERRYALRAVKQRLHQASFREAVIAAYNGRCALSGLPEPLLLDAAHIVSDKDERLGQPIVPNGIPLSKIHHAAFDAHLIGIDTDYRLHVSDRLLQRVPTAVNRDSQGAPAERV